MVGMGQVFDKRKRVRERDIDLELGRMSDEMRMGSWKSVQLNNTLLISLPLSLSLSLLLDFLNLPFSRFTYLSF